MTDIYTLTVIDMVSDPVLGTRRTPAAFTTLQKAIQAVKNNECDLSDGGFYQYAVIEKTKVNTIRPDLHLDTERFWFKFNTALQEFEMCELSNLPKTLTNLKGFGIG